MFSDSREGLKIRSRNTQLNEFATADKAKNINYNTQSKVQGFSSLPKIEIKASQ